MKTVKSLYIMSVIFLLTVFQACKEEEYSPLNKGGSAPAKVSDVKIAPLPGAARISYQVPDDKNFLYVKAEAEIRPGVIREIKASYYTSELVIDGFSDTTEFVVRLYSVGRNDMVSEPEIVTVVPKTPPVFSVFESLKETIVETFGGIKFEMDNPSGAEVRIYVNTTDSLGNMVPAEIFYTSAATDRFSVRGYDTDARPFSIYVQDRWGNTSGTYENIFHPLLEKKLDKTKFRSTPLTGDMNDIIQQNRPITNLWDDALTDATMYQTNSGIKSLPHTFTIDLGVKAYLSRVVTHGRVSTNAGFLYNAGMPQQWEIYGSTDPNPDGSLDESWIPLREGPCVSFKPSGLPLGEVSDDDYQRQLNGEEFEFDRSDILVRYIRFSINSAWGGLSTSFFNMTEITLFGNVEEEIQ